MTESKIQISPLPQLILVYNADTGWLSAIKDAIHKIVRPATYPCSLCQISYGPVSMRRAWRSFLNRLPLEKRFYHRQDFAEDYPVENHPLLTGLALPVILLQDDDDLQVVLSSTELDQLPDVTALIKAVDDRLPSRLR